MWCTKIVHQGDRKVIHYHGGPITPVRTAIGVWSRGHAFVSFARPDQIALAAEVSQTFAVDSGAFSSWTKGVNMDVVAYADWVQTWGRHPGFDWCLIPDVIDGDEKENDSLISRWCASVSERVSVPVWHMHESIARLQRLTEDWPRVALGSSGRYASVGSEAWWGRMRDAMDAVCDADGRPRTKLHGLRMLNSEVFTRLPLSSADSTNLAQNHSAVSLQYGLTDGTGAAVLQSRIESKQSASAWNRGASGFSMFEAIETANL